MVFLEVKSSEEFFEILESNKASGTPLIVQFSTHWCGPCQKIKPHFVELAESVLFTCVYVDVEQCEEVGAAFKVKSFPTFTAFQGGKELFRLRYSSSHFQKLQSLFTQLV